MTESNWSEDRITTLTSLWLNGLSASQIAKSLGGVTRNAVMRFRVLRRTWKR